MLVQKMFDPQKNQFKNLAKIGSDIADMVKCYQDKCCMVKCHPAIWHLADVEIMVQPSCKKLFKKLSSTYAAVCQKYLQNYISYQIQLNSVKKINIIFFKFSFMFPVKLYIFCAEIFWQASQATRKLRIISRSEVES